MKPYLSCWSYGYHGKDDDFIKDLYKLSAHLLLVNYGEVHLVTDKEGKERLKNIPFTSINTSLEILPKNLKVLWSLGKVLAYKIISEKGEPFFHIDNDVFLFKKLPEEILNKEVITQHKEEDAHYFYEVNSFTENIPNKFYLEKEKISYYATQLLKVERPIMNTQKWNNELNKITIKIGWEMEQQTAEVAVAGGG
jgi:hypothetical protein